MKIKVVSNGYIVKFKDEEGNPCKVVIEENPEERQFDPVAVNNLLHTILDHLGVFLQNRKYEKTNVSIEIKRGTHYDCKEKDCEVCNGEV